MVHKLTLFFPDDFGDPLWAGSVYALEAPDDSSTGEWVLGRSPAADLTINHRMVSVRHAVIAYSFAADRWSLNDLKSSNGTYLNGARVTAGNAEPLNIGDRFYLGTAAAKVHCVEDEQDTISPDEAGPETVASTTPLATLPPAPASPPPPARTLADSVYLAAQWLVSGTTVAGKVYRVVLLAASTAFVVVLIDLAQR